MEIFQENEDEIIELKNSNIFLSKIDLENDLYEAIGERLEEILGDSPIQYLQSSKLLNMIELAQELNNEDCKAIIDHELFEALKKLVLSDVS